MRTTICVLRASRSIPVEASRRLFAAAQGLYASKRGSMRLDMDEYCFGEVRNLNQSGSLETLAGPLFEASLTLRGGHSVEVLFLVPWYAIEAEVDLRQASYAGTMRSYQA